jgi:hypothetical protein
MENHHRNTKNDGFIPTPGKRSKTDQRWTLLFIGNHGKTITLKQFKSVVLLSGLVLVVSIAITIGLLYFSFNVHQKKGRLEVELQDLKDQVKALRYEKDVLMTKLVLAESRTKQMPVPNKKKPIVPGALPDQKAQSEKPQEPVRIAAAKNDPPVKKTAPPPAVVPVPELSVDIENFKVIPKKDENLLRVQFKIKNTTPKSQRVSGHTIVVLKSDSSGRDRWLTIPTMALSNGKPTGRQRGYSFGINNFKTMRLKTNLPKSPEIYRNATVYVFTKQGDLLLEKNFPVNLPATQINQPVVPATPKPSASATAPAAKPPGTASSAQPAPSGTTMPSTDELMNALKNTTTE